MISNNAALIAHWCETKNVKEPNVRMSPNLEAL